MRKIAQGSLLVLAMLSTVNAQEVPTRDRTILGRGPVDYWGTRKPTPPKEEKTPGVEESLWAEPTRLSDGRIVTYVPPRAVLELLENPTPESAKGYLAWQRERVARLRKAMEVLEAAASEEAKLEPSTVKKTPKTKRQDERRPASRLEILYFKQAGCAYCDLQDKTLAKLLKDRRGVGLREIKKGESADLWKKYGVTVTPTLVVIGPSGDVTLRGLATGDQIVGAIKEAESHDP